MTTGPIGSVPSTTVDRLALRELVDAYASAADAGDPLAFASLFLDGARLSVRRGDGPPTVYAGSKRLAEIPGHLARYDLTFHVVTNHHVDLDGDAAAGESLCQAHHVTNGQAGATDLVLAIRYRDQYARTPAGWRFATREVHILWTSEIPVTVP